jgi:hypothetical protein
MTTQRSDYEHLLGKVKSVDFITPVIDCNEFRTDFADLLRRAADGYSKVTIHVPSETTENRLRVGAYSKSLLHLIENSFSSLHKTKPNFIGKAEASVLARDPDALNRFGPEIARRAIRIEEGSDPLRHEDLHQRTNLMAWIITEIAHSLEPGGK